MSMLWTQGRHVASACRCTLCHPSGVRAAAKRRAGGTIRHQPQQHRSVGLPISMTLFYGTIMGAALYSDARVKLDKRRRLDAAIDYARAEAQELAEANHARMLDIGRKAIEEYWERHSDRDSPIVQHEEVSIKMIKRIGWLRHQTQKMIELLPTLRDEEQLTATATRLAKLQKKLQAMLKRGLSGLAPEGQITPEKELRHMQDWQWQRARQAFKEKDRLAVRSHLLSPLLHRLSGADEEQTVPSRSAEELWATEEPAFTFSEYWTRRQEVALTLLVNQMLRYAISTHGMSFVQKQLDSDSVLRQVDLSKVQSGEAINTVSEQLRTLIGLHLDQKQSDDVKTTPLMKLGAAAHMAEHDIAQSRKTLNNALFDAFGSQYDDKRSLIVSLCQVLARVHVSPDTKMFNTLLVNLLRLQHVPLVVDAWRGLHFCGLVCNETSVATVLKAFTSCSSGAWFRRTAEQLDVLRGDGLITLSDKSWHLAELYPDSISDESWLGMMVLNRYRKFEATKVRFLRLPRNEDLFSALVIGFIEMNDLGSAGKEFSKYLASGLPLSLDLWNAMLQRVLQARDLEIGRSLSRWILDGKVRGLRASMTDAVYIMSEIAGLHSSREQGEADMYEINKFAAQHGLLAEPLAWIDSHNNKDRKDRDYDVMLQRMTLLRRINRPVLHLHFGSGGVENLSQDVTDPALNDMPWQPRDLYQYAAMRLRSVHERFELHYGPLAETEQNKQLLEGVRKATTQVEFWCRSQRKDKAQVSHWRSITKESMLQAEQRATPSTAACILSQLDNKCQSSQSEFNRRDMQQQTLGHTTHKSELGDEIMKPLGVPISLRELPYHDGELKMPQVTGLEERSSAHMMAPSSKGFDSVVMSEEERLRRDVHSGSLQWVTSC